MKNEGIIPGYHGIMDLDVRNMDPRYIKQAIEQHENDIKIYKLSTLPKRLNSSLPSINC